MRTIILFVPVTVDSMRTIAYFSVQKFGGQVSALITIFSESEACTVYLLNCSLASYDSD